MGCNDRGCPCSVCHPELYAEVYAQHKRHDWTETDERLAIWDEEENGYVMFPPGGRHKKEN